MSYTVVYTDVSVSQITGTKTLKNETVQIDNVKDFIDMCARLNVKLTGKDGLVRSDYPIMDGDKIIGMAYTYVPRKGVN